MIDDDPIGARWMRERQALALLELARATEPQMVRYLRAVAAQASAEAAAREAWLERHPRHTWRAP